MSFNFRNPSKFFTWFYSLACPFYAKSVYRELLKALEFRSSEKILDFGSGAGVLAKKILKKLNPLSAITCLDKSDAFLNKAKRKLRKFKNIDFILGDIREKNLPKNYFDKIFITWVIHHLPNTEREEIIGAIIESLKPDGIIYVIEYLSMPHGIQKNELNEIFSKFQLFPHEIYFKKHTLLIEYKYAS